MPAPPTSKSAADETLERAQKDRLEVAQMRGRTAKILHGLDELLAENHLAERIKRSWG